jgi:hypothetical protein
MLEWQKNALFSADLLVRFFDKFNSIIDMPVSEKGSDEKNGDGKKFYV